MSVPTRGLQLRHAPARGALAGWLYGLVIGGIAGTWAFPFVGTLFWAVAGAVLGALVGTMTGAVLQAVKPVTTARWALRLVGGLAAGAFSSVIASVLDQGWIWLGTPTVMVVLAIAIGAGLAPWIADEDSETMRTRVDTGRRLLVAGATTGAALGAVVGLGIGVVTYLPTSPVALIEGAVLGATTGLVLATMLLLAVLSLRPSQR